MFARGTNGGDVMIQVVFHGLLGNTTGILNRSDEAGAGAWDATDPCASLLALPLGTAYATIKLTSASGTWTIDDVFEDPSVFRVG